MISHLSCGDVYIPHTRVRSNSVFGDATGGLFEALVRSAPVAASLCLVSPAVLLLSGPGTVSPGFPAVKIVLFPDLRNIPPPTCVAAFPPFTRLGFVLTLACFASLKLVGFGFDVNGKDAGRVTGV